MTRTAPRNVAAPLLGEPHQRRYRREASETALGRAAAPFVGHERNRRFYKPGGYLRDNAPFCDPEGTNPLDVWGRHRALDSKRWMGGKGIGYALRDVR